ncbi:hypothetical protein [Falsiroseomonas sp.]|uniref:hypothetical protein n=1 Tax=Falsiroseomonas sp. TaxID=2870721 RepID=UPI002727DE6D|nr:hypothetical protein [Falsiroseomonas sp.]MDO9502774.1 hypothetical protein [Falsiroseomonas sp.]
MSNKDFAVSENNETCPDLFYVPDDPTPRDEAIYTVSVTASHSRSVYNGIHRNAWKRPMPEGVGERDLNFLDPTNTLFRNSTVLFSAGQALGREDGCIVTERDRIRTRLICDSGGYQIAHKQLHINGDGDRRRILRWQERLADYAITLDAPPGPIAQKKPGYMYKTTADCLRATCEHLDFMRDNRGSSDVQFLNVLQGNTPEEADIWYDTVKDYPTEGWAIAGVLRHNMFELTRRMIVMLGEKKLGDRPRWVHVLGTAELDAAVMLTGAQRMLNDMGVPVRISFDTSGPFLNIAKHQAYTLPHLTDTKMTMDSARYPDGHAFIGSDKLWPWPSPIGNRMKMRDLCVKPYVNGGRSFYDGLSYALLANHNLSAFCFGIAQANRVFTTESTNHIHSVGSREGAALQAMRKALQSQSMDELNRQKATFDKLRHRYNYDEGRESVPEPE